MRKLKLVGLKDLLSEIGSEGYLRCVVGILN